MANLNPSPATRFRRGRSGNPGGKVRDPLTQALRAKLTEADAETIAETVLSFAKAGAPWAVKELWDRLEGKAVARQESGDPGTWSDLEDVPTEEIQRRLIELREHRERSTR